jgi:16S rRNA (uracil1498-N3)-methyltransferase
MISRFHFPGRLPDAGQFELPEALAHHAVRVLRLRDGEAVVLFDGLGGEADATLVVEGRRVSARLGARRDTERESPLQVVLVQALAAGDKMDWVVQKAVELGVSAIQPVQAERSVLRLAGERADKRVAHWQQVAVAACEQCGRNRIPELRALQPVTHWLAAHRDALNYVLAPGGAASFGEEAAPQGTVHLLVGPEGGWSDAEMAAFDAAGCRRVRLGPRVLRTETAGLAAIAALQARWGDF